MPNVHRVIERNDTSDRSPATAWHLVDAPLPVTQLRLAAGLAAAIPGAELRARCSTGAELVVGEHPAADVTPSTMRSVAIETWRRSRWQGRGAAVPTLGELRLGGSIDDLGGGVLRVIGNSGVEQRWLASVLPPDELVDLLSPIGLDGAVSDVGGADQRTGHIADADRLRARIVPDRHLGVALIEITAAPDVPLGLLDRSAADAAARCYVAELLHAVSPVDGH